MKRGKIIVALLFGALILSGLQIPKARIEVEVLNIQTQKGTIDAYLFRRPENFPVHKDKAFRHVSVRVDGDRAYVEFRDVPYGEYVVSIYHDANGNGRFDRNFFGLPAEPYALSGTPKFRFGPPLFEDCKIKIDRPVVHLRMRLKD